MPVNVADIAVQSITGQEKALADYQGKVLLIVNVASFCGYTPQYAGLQKLHEQYAASGLSVLAFPCNDFGAQEPGSPAEIQDFCTTRYGVGFELFDKLHAKGLAQHPLYQKLSQVEPGGEVSWNFEKFLVDKQGSVVGRFKSAVSPDAPELIAAIEQALAA
jgi:glutathione peroxidase